MNYHKINSSVIAVLILIIICLCFCCAKTIRENNKLLDENIKLTADIEFIDNLLMGDNKDNLPADWPKQ